MDVVNASIYDWATALGEAARMAGRLTGRGDVIVPEFISPDRKQVLGTYVEPMDMKILEVGQSRETGQVDLEDLKEKASSDTAAVYLENPSYLGFLEAAVEEIGEVAHDAGAIYIVGGDPMCLGIMKPPGAYGADIAVSEGQPLGNPMSLGGPLLGVLACKDDHRMIRAMPGRVIGMTTSLDGTQRAFVMALQTREQHIRRERATSNICTNQGLCAVASAVYLSLLGGGGVKELSRHILAKTRYAIDLFNSIEGVEVPLFRAPHFKEFTLGFAEAHVDDVSAKLLDRGICGGKSIKEEFPILGEALLTCVTEVHTKEQIDSYAFALRKILGET